MRSSLKSLIYLVTFIYLTSLILKYIKELRWENEISHSPMDIFRAKLSATSKQKIRCMDEKRHVVFIKVHKAGSSTIANILFRFGMRRKLTFLLPDKGVTVAYHLTVPWTNIMELPTGAKHYDILSNHAIYIKSEIDRLFPSDRVVISILRHPMGQLESSIYYYYKDVIEGTDKAGAYLKNPKSLKISDCFVNNSMAFELGVPRSQFNNASFVKAHVQQLAKDIELVLIMERLKESLVLLKRRLCWSLKDIVYITINANKNKPSIKRSDVDFWNHHTMMEANYIVYEYFYKRLEDEIAASPRLDEEVNRYNDILQIVSKFCLEARMPDNSTIKIEKTEWNEAFSLSDKDCGFLQLSGLEVLRHAKNYQYGEV